jgi:hypothetical protein
VALRELPQEPGEPARQPLRLGGVRPRARYLSSAKPADELVAPVSLHAPRRVHADDRRGRQRRPGPPAAPVRAYMEDLLPDVVEGRIEPGRVLDRTVGLDGVPDGYRAMNERESIKVMVRP